MNNTIELLRIFRKLLGLREVGNTTLMKKGTENYDREFYVVSNSLDYSKEIVGASKYGNVVTMNNVEKLNGISSPVLIDHHLVAFVLANAIEKMDRNEEEMERMKKVIDKLMSIAEYYQDRSHKTEDLTIELLTCKWWQFSKKSRIKSELWSLILNNSKSPTIDELFGNIEDIISSK